MELKEEKDLLMKDYYFEQDVLNEFNEEINKLSKAINNWDLKETKYCIQLENINSKLLEEYELEYAEAVKLRIDIEDIKRQHKM